MNWRVTKNENPLSEFDLYWQDLGIDSERLQTLKPYQKVNHFPAMFHITRKTFLAKNLKKLQRLFPLEYDFFPKTWILPNELNDLRTYSQKTEAIPNKIQQKIKKKKDEEQKEEEKLMKNKEKDKFKFEKDYEDLIESTQNAISNQIEVKQEMTLAHGYRH